MGLTSHHQGQIGELLRYSRFKRSERLVGIELCFQDFIETRVYEEETYTQDEVVIGGAFYTWIYCSIVGQRDAGDLGTDGEGRVRVRIHQLVRHSRTFDETDDATSKY